MATPEPQADYTQQTTTAPATSSSKPCGYARIAYLDDKGHPRDAYGIRIDEWEPFVDCFPNFFMATLCPCVTVGQIAHRLGGSFWCTSLSCLTWIIVAGVGLYKAIDANFRTEYEVESTSTDAWGTTTYHEVETSASYGARIGWGLVFGLGGAAWMTILMHYRSKIRKRYTIAPAETCFRNTECIVAIFCYSCLLGQMAGHIRSYRPHSCHFLPAVDVLPPLDQENVGDLERAAR